MPRQLVKKTYFTFVGGLNTEAGYLTFPPNVWKDGDNVIPQVDGSLHLRTAMNYETSSQLSTHTQTSDEKTYLAYGVHEWNNVNGQGFLNYIVAQKGRYLVIYENTATAMSTTEKTGAYVLDLNTYKAGTNPDVIGSEPIQVANVNGKLIVTSSSTEPILLEDNGSGLTVTTINVEYRDFDGAINDTYLGSQVDTQPSILDNAHKYNLLNQGWTDSYINSFFSSQSKYPSNAQQWHAGKDTDDNFDPALLQKQDFGKSRAPRGRYILNAHQRDRQTASGVTFTTETENYRVQACAFFAGRAWYAGVYGSAKISSWVFFSQVALNDGQLGYCYQEADPTSEQISDLLASDGGVVVIQGVGEIYKLVPLDRSLLVFADNGVWSISGTIQDGFTADGYEVKQVTTVGALNAESVVAVENSVFYWAADGIWQIAPNPQSGFMSAVNVTENRIASFYQDINKVARDYASGRYHVENKTVYWAYQASPNADNLSNLYKKDKLLILDLRLNSFYTMTINALVSNSPEIVDFVVTKNRTSNEQTFDITSIASGLVTTNAGVDQVVEDFDVGAGDVTAIKWFTIVLDASVYKATWSEFEDGSDMNALWKDWYDKDSTGIAFTGYIITGFDVGVPNGGDKALQGIYVTVLMKRTETGIDASGNPIRDSSVLMSSRWDFTDSTVANKWRTAVECYKHKRLYIPASLPSATFDDGYPVVVKKEKLRGRGNAFQLKFESTSGKDMQIIGWSIPVAINAD